MNMYKKLYIMTAAFFTVAGLSNAEEPSLDVMQLRAAPPGIYEVSLQHQGRGEKVKVTLSIKNNKAKLVETSSKKFDGLKGEFKLIGNGVFRARLKFKAGSATQLWVFHPDGSATIKETPDRGEKQSAKLISKQEAYTRKAFAGKYELHKPKNDWHYVEIEKFGPKSLKWTNRSGIEWILTPTDDHLIFNIGKDCPYYKDGIRAVTFSVDKGVMIGVMFNKDYYEKKEQFSN